MTNPGLPEGKKITLKADRIVEEAVALLKTSRSKEVQVWKFSPVSQYQPQGLAAKFLSVIGHIDPQFLTGTAKAVYGCCAAKALKPVIKRLPKGERVIVISARK